MSSSLYVHVPFCVVKCGYCDFNSYAIDDAAAHTRFVDALDLERRAVCRLDHRVSLDCGDWVFG